MPSLDDLSPAQWALIEAAVFAPPRCWEGILRPLDDAVRVGSGEAHHGDQLAVGQPLGRLSLYVVGLSRLAGVLPPELASSRQGSQRAFLGL